MTLRSGFGWCSWMGRWWARLDSCESWISCRTHWRWISYCIWRFQHFRKRWWSASGCIEASNPWGWSQSQSQGKAKPKVSAKAKAQTQAPVQAPAELSYSQVKEAYQGTQSDWEGSEERTAAIQKMTLSEVRKRRFEQYRPDCFEAVEGEPGKYRLKSVSS